jgi:hypothetical protein
MDTNVVEIDQYVAASPGTVYALVSDIARMATGAPGTCECRWVGAAAGPVVGALSRPATDAGGSGGATRRP